VTTKPTPAPTVRLLQAVPEFEDAVQVLCEAFNTDSPHDLINTSLMKALATSGNYVAGVFLADELAGVLVAWRGRAGRLHSHIAGVHPKHQGLGLGYELKMHERRWARARGLSGVEWTFDPLVRRNAYFNLGKLGARVRGFHPNFYGKLEDGLNSGDDTDRLLVEWDIRPATADPWVGEHSSGLLGPVALDPGSWNFEPPPEVTVASPDDSIRLVLTPYDIEGLRVERPELVTRWRHAVRLGFSAALDAGFTVTGFTVDGCYVLRRPVRRTSTS